ncbi:MAG: nitronate monooxygenase [Mycobacterium sp.]|uniref:nitronate monooxygenase n=1 Tax=Mycobacterium sp. TaxID=1785 RepID=UPI001EC10E9A|nr:nitronate monooxygenase [Mycobacterium sp.]MBW0019440.1 nitronate monooxygenase [Mycobacterium sp.]
MHSSIGALGVTSPVLAAPMAGGPGTPQLVIAAAAAGSMGFLAGGYKTPDALATEIQAVRGAQVTFGVNLFAPNPVPIDEGAYQTYRQAIQAEANRYGLDLSTVPRTEHDDHWPEKIDLLLSNPVPVVSFTFGVPDPSVFSALRKAGSVVAQTVTSADEARLAAESGAELLIVQASAAGGHSGTLTPEHIPAEIPLPQLLSEIAGATRLPMIGGGGIAAPADVAAALAAGATAVAVGTALLLSPESGASSAHRVGLTDSHPRGTVVTRAFTGRPARGLRNEFTERYSALAPTGYPAVHYLTSPLRKAGAAANDPEVVNLWAGTGYRHAAARPAAQTLAALAAV